MVTSQKMSENEMGYRGSKSEIKLYRNPQSSVKEQRVDGSYFVNISKLRCTLTDLGKGYHIKIPSKQLVKSRNVTYCYSTLTTKSKHKIDP